MAIPAINPYTLQFQLLQQQLERRRALAQALEQQSMTPLQSQTVGPGSNPVVVRHTPLEAIAKLAQAAGGSYMQNQVDQDSVNQYGAIAQAMMGAQRDALGRLAGAPGQSAPPQPDPAASAPQPQPVNEPPPMLRDPNLPPPQAAAPPQAVPQAQPVQPGQPSLQDTLEAAQNATMYGVDPEIVKAVVASRMPTDQMRNDLAVGVTPAERRTLMRRESVRQAYVPGSGGALDVDANGNPVFRDLPGMAESQAGVAGATKEAQELATPKFIEDPLHPGSGRFMYPQARATLGAIGGAGGVAGAGRLPTAADLEGQKKGAEQGQIYAKEVNDNAAAALEGKRTLSEMGNLLQGFQPGKFAPVLSGMGSAAVSLGVSPETVTQLTNINPGDAEAFQKGTAALATEAAKQVSSRVTQMEFKTFLANNPNWMMTPNGIKRVMDFMNKGFDSQLDRQSQFADWSKDKSPDRWAIDFPSFYNKQQLANIKAGKTNSPPPSQSPTRTLSDTQKAAVNQGGAVDWKQGMTIDAARKQYKPGTVFRFPDGSLGAL